MGIHMHAHASRYAVRGLAAALVLCQRMTLDSLSQRQALNLESPM